jgi:hypothetical protein
MIASVQACLTLYLRGFLDGYIIDYLIVKNSEEESYNKGKGMNFHILLYIITYDKT